MSSCSMTLCSRALISPLSSISRLVSERRASGTAVMGISILCLGTVEVIVFGVDEVVTGSPIHVVGPALICMYNRAEQLNELLLLRKAETECEK